MTYCVVNGRNLGHVYRLGLTLTLCQELFPIPATLWEVLQSFQSASFSKNPCFWLIIALESSSTLVDRKLSPSVVAKRTG